MNRPPSRSDPSIISISSTSSTSNGHYATSPTAIPNAPYHLVTGHMISWAYSDGANWLPRNQHHRGSTHYCEVVEPESRAYQKYLEQIGTYVAKTVFGYTDAPYFMVGLPAGYSLYCGHSEPQSTGRPRKDLYLYGPEKMRPFRSPNEFTMHAVWLMGGGPCNPSLCQCIHCGPHNSQIVINNQHGLPGQRNARDHHHHQ